MPVTTVNGNGTINSAIQRKTGLYSEDDFLQIMARQIKSQVPGNPMESHEFVTQFAQAAQMEQMQNITTGVSDTKAAGTMSQWLSAMGKKMNVDGNVMSQGDEVYLRPAGDYDQVMLTLQNQADGSIKEVTLEKGEAMVFKNTDDATYSISATAIKNNQAVACKTSLFRVVSGVQMGEDGCIMVAGDGKGYAAGGIRRLKE
jgi:flagellar hook assembly protein FlgD